LIGGAAAVAVIVVALVVVVALRSGEPEASVPPPVVVIEPTAPPSEPTPAPIEVGAPAGNPVLEQAQAALDAGDTDGARAAVGALTAEDEAALTEEERARLEEMRGLLGGAGTDRAVSELRMGLGSGSIRMVRRAVDELSDVPSSEIRSRKGLAKSIGAARQILQAHTLMWRAKRAGDHLQVLERARTLIQLIPKYSSSFKLRREAAAAIEKQAGAAAAKGEFERALRLLGDERSLWPKRAGLDGRIADIRRSAEEHRKMAQVLSRGEAALAAKKPEAGLRALAGTTQGAAYAAQFEELRQKLEAQLARLDKNPPTVTMAGDVRLRYRKNKTLVIPFTVTDDHGVKLVKVMFRPEGKGSFEGRTVKPLSDGSYRFEVTPQIHGNKTVEVYVVATDRSGHKGFLGTPRQPLQVVRKKWYQKK